MSKSLLVLCSLAWSAGANAQCTKDVDCKGDRICQHGTCVELHRPDGVKEPVSRPPEVPRDDWAQPASVIGFASAAVVLGLAIGSEVTRKNQVPSLPLGVGATVLLGVMAPVVAVGAASARGYGEPGSGFGLRLAGWFAYGLAMVDALALIGVGIADVTPPPGVIALTGALGTISLVSLGLDALFSHQDAAARRAVPAALLIRLRDGRTAPALGMVATF